LSEILWCVGGTTGTSASAATNIMESIAEAGCQCFRVDVCCGRRVLVIDTLSVVWLQDHGVLRIREFLEVEGEWDLTLDGEAGLG
jgi:hypothetical protein